MSRRFQFSLRGLLGLAAIFCILLGSGHIVATYGSYVAANPTKVRQPVAIYGRIVRPFGPAQLDYAIAWQTPGNDDPGRRNYWMPFRSDRKWLCFYDIRAEIRNIYPGKYEIAVVADPLSTNEVAVTGAMEITR